MKQIFIAWEPYQRRPDSMQDFFGYELHFISTPFRSKPLRIVDYLIKAVRTLALLLRKRPDVVWIQIAPIFAAQTVDLYRSLFRRDLVVIGDCHNSAFAPRWLKIPFALRTLNRVSLLLPHNEFVVDKACAAGIRRDLLQALETRPARLERARRTKEGDDQGPPLILFPCSFRSDEPVDVFLEAARGLPEAQFIVTGNYQRMNAQGMLGDVPDNVTLTGFVSVEEYNDLLFRANVIVGLTTLENTQLSVANEAAGAGRPMVISDTKTLRALFGRGAHFVDAMSAESIREGCRYALEHQAELSEKSRSLQVWREDRWRAQARLVAERLMLPLPGEEAA